MNLGRICFHFREVAAFIASPQLCLCVGKEKAARDSGIQFVSWQPPISLPWGLLTAGWPWLQQEPWWETSGRQWNSRHFLLHLQDPRAKSRGRLKCLSNGGPRNPKAPSSHSSCFPLDNPVRERMYVGPVVSSMKLTEVTLA